MNQALQHASNLQKLIEEKNYVGLDAYLTENRPKGTCLHYCQHQINLINIAVKLRDSNAIEVLIKHGANSLLDDRGESLTSDDRIFLAQFYSDQNDPAAYHRRVLISHALLRGSLKELRYWHEEREYLLSAEKQQVMYISGNNFLGYTCSAGYNDCVEYLVTKVGCDVNAQFFFEQSNSTPLKAALCNSKIDTAELLVKLGADVHLEFDDRVPSRNCAIKRSLIQHLARVHQAEDEIKGRIEGLRWALKMGSDDLNTSFISDDYSFEGTHFLPNAPALVLACLSKAPEFVALLLEFQKERWINHGGPLLEVIPMVHHYKISQERLTALIELILPLVDPKKKEEHFGNALAAAILNEDEMYEDYLRNTLGADLMNVTKKDKYSPRQARLFKTRMKLARDGVDCFIEDYEAKEYVLARVDIPTKTASIGSIRKKMKNIKGDSEIFYEMDAWITDAEGYNNIWKQFKHPHLESLRPISPILLLDKSTNKIYKGVPPIEDLALDKTHPGQMLVPFVHTVETIFQERFAVFAQAMQEHDDEKKISLPKGYRIIFKPVSFEVAKAMQEFHNQTKAHNDIAEKPQEMKHEDDPEEDQVGGGRPSRRAARTAKRKIGQVDSDNDEQNASNKRRKTKK